MTTRSHFATALILSFMLLTGGCSREKPANTTKDARPEAVSGMPQNDWDMVQIAVAVYAKQSSFNPCLVSKRIETLLEKYATNTTFNMSAKGVMWHDFEVSIPEGGQLTFDFKSDRPVTVTFEKGTVGIRSEEIWIDENTEVEVAGTRYVFRKGQWSK
jgi:hypothetical protein